MAGYSSRRVLEIFRNCDIDYRHFYIEAGQKRDETPSELNARYLRAMETGCRAVTNCLQSAELTPMDVDLFVVCTSTGYVCPDLGSRLIGHMGFRPDIKRTPIVGLGCAGALSGLQRVCDFVLAQPRRTALMLAGDLLRLLLCRSGGQERTEAEFGRLFNASGFCLTRVVTTMAPVSIIEGIPSIT